MSRSVMYGEALLLCAAGAIGLCSCVCSLSFVTAAPAIADVVQTLDSTRGKTPLEARDILRRHPILSSVRAVFVKPGTSQQLIMLDQTVYFVTDEKGQTVTAPLAGETGDVLKHGGVWNI